MALTAVLEFGDNNIKRYSKQYLVSDFRFVFNRAYTSFSPEGGARCKQVEVTVVAPGRNDLSLFEWFSTQGEQSGRILISLSNEDKLSESDTQSLFFEDAKCFSLNESYDVEQTRRRYLKLAIGAEQIKIDDVFFKRI